MIIDKYPVKEYIQRIIVDKIWLYKEQEYQDIIKQVSRDSYTESYVPVRDVPVMFR